MSAACCCLVTSLVISAAPTKTPVNSPTLSQDLTSLPTPVAVSPFTVELGYTGETMNVVSGGLGHDSIYRGRLEVVAQSDLAEAFGAPEGTTFRINLRTPHGSDMSGGRHSDLQGTSNIPPYHYLLVHELWLGGKISSQLGWRAGRLQADGDFATTQSGAVFLNGRFGWPAFIGANVGGNGPDFDRRAIGVFAHFDHSEKLHTQAGLYDGETPDAPTSGASPRHGVFGIAEVVLDTNLGTAGLTQPGALKIGIWKNTGDFNDQAQPSKIHRGNQGFYLVAEQMVWREPSPVTSAPQGLTVFARTGFSPADRSAYSQTANLGVTYTGLFPGRDGDMIGLAAAWAHVSSDRRKGEQASGAIVSSAREVVVEGSYKLLASRHWEVIPNVQWISHPGGSSTRDAALVLGVRTHFFF